MNMRKSAALWLTVFLALQGASGATAQTNGLENDALTAPPSASLSKVVYKGKPAVRLTDRSVAGAAAMIPLKIRALRNGTITADIAAQPREGAPASARGFVGVAFRVADENRYEAIYIRPTNGRSDDQLRRNHTVQYVSLPDFGGERLRRESPGQYESYADVAPGEWSRLRITVDGQTARLFVDEDDQPALIVNDLKLGAESRGGVALWLGPNTDAYFANVSVEPRD